MSWSAQQYLAFEDERTRPVRDLLSAVPEGNVQRAIDLGCGPGNSTEVLQARFPGADISGIDSSQNMIDAARQRLPRLHFAVADVTNWQDPRPFQVILANAVLQWVPDHATLLPALVARLSPAGALAVQMPDNLDVPAHRLMRECALQGPWAGKLAGALQARGTLHSAEGYYRILRAVCARVDIWRTTYYHVLSGGAAAVVEWFKGSGLRPYLEPLAEAERCAYLERYSAAIERAYQALPDGSVLLPFPRLFLVAVR